MTPARTLVAAALAASLALPAAAAAQSGGTIAYLGASPSRGIYTVPSGGGTPQLVVANAQSPAWSPNGGQIAAIQTGGGFPSLSLVVAPAAGGATTTLAAEAGDPAWSPNGRKIAYVTNDSSLSVVAATGGKPRTLVPASSARTVPSSPVWSASGRSLFYLATAMPADAPPPGQAPLTQVRTVSATGKRNRAVSIGLPSGWAIEGYGSWGGMDISPSGGMLAFTAVQSTPSPPGSPVPSIQAYGIALVSSGGGTATVIPGFFMPAFSPDGTQLCASQPQPMGGDALLTVLTTAGAVVSQPAGGVDCAWQPS